MCCQVGTPRRYAEDGFLPTAFRRSPKWVPCRSTYTITTAARARATAAGASRDWAESVGSHSSFTKGTVPFVKELWLPTLSAQSRLAPAAVALALAAVVIVYVLLQGTHFGLRLKAVGKNSSAAYLLGVPTWQHMMISFALCGVFAGLAGAVQVTAVYHRLIPSISSGYGYLGLMVAMLAGFRAALAAVVALFFAALNVGSIQLPIVLKQDSSLAGVLQGTLVLFVLLAQGVRQRLSSRTSRRAS